MKELKIGDKIWYAWTGHKEVTNVCPICDGKLKVTLVLGNGNQVVLDCSYCNRGYEGSSGVERYYQYVIEVREETIKEIRVEHNERGIKTEYLSMQSSFLEPENIFDTRELAEKRSTVLVAERNQKENDALSKKDKIDKSYAWHAGYHLKEAKRAKEQLEYHSKKAVLMKQK